MTDQAQGQSEQPSIRERIGAVLSASDEQPNIQADEAPQQTEAGATETEKPQNQEVQETAPDPTADWEEVELDGERLQVPPKFRKAFLQERDYTQKAQMVAEEKRFIESQKQGLVAQQQTLQQLQPLFAQAAMIDNTLQAYQRIDWDSLRANDPLDYSTKRADYAALLQQRQDLNGNIQSGREYLDLQRQQLNQQATQAAQPIIKKAIPDWGVEKDTQLTRFALNNGATAEELMGLAARPWAVILLEQARKYQELQASKAQLPKKVQNLSPVAKPGAKSTVQSAGDASYRKHLETFRKSGGKDPDSLRAILKAKFK